MEPRLHIAVVARRDVLLGGVAAATVAALVAPSRSGAQEKPPGNGIEEALRKIMGEGKPADGRITMELPEIAENGNTVPYVLTVDSPMTEASHVKALHVLGAGNPQPSIASFFFSPRSGKAQVSSRMRLARTQDVVAVAELSDGRFIVGRRSVRVTIGGCGG